jgi:hypothetical protein
MRYVNQSGRPGNTRETKMRPMQDFPPPRWSVQLFPGSAVAEPRIAMPATLMAIRRSRKRRVEDGIFRCLFIGFIV